MKYGVSLYLIFKDEAPFLKEWIDYHKLIGVAHFYLYNNDSADNFREVLSPYIEQGLVTLIDFPSRNMQISSYKDCYKRFRGETNWLCSLDADEFICMTEKRDIHEWLKDYDKYPAVVMNFLHFGTGGRLKHDFSRLVIEQYTSCQAGLFGVEKTFVNTRFDLSPKPTVRAFPFPCASL